MALPCTARLHHCQRSIPGHGASRLQIPPLVNLCDCMSDNVLSCLWCWRMSDDKMSLWSSITVEIRGIGRCIAIANGLTAPHD